VRKRIGHDVALRLPLDAVIADRRGGVHGLADVVFIDGAGESRDMMGPHAGEKIVL